MRRYVATLTSMVRDMDVHIEAVHGNRLGPRASVAAGGEAARERTSRRAAIALVVVVVLAGLIALGAWLLAPPPLRTYPVTARELAGAHAALDSLDLISTDSGPVYDRAAFGQAWADENLNGCDTRNDILARDLSTPILEPGTGECTVNSGQLTDRYTGATIDFVRGKGTSGLVQIDHVVALSDAWRSGASSWDGPTRQRFANDPANLIAVDGPANQKKSSLNASQWVPPNKEFRCHFAVVQVRVKAAYSLGVTEAEASALRALLGGCTVVDG